MSTIAWIVGLAQPVFTVFGNEFSWKDLILIGGGLFLMWKATKEIPHTVDPAPEKPESMRYREASFLRRSTFD